MLAYAAHRRSRRRLSPSTLVLIVGAHAVALGVLATARMDVTGSLPPVITDVFNVPEPLPPEPDIEPRPPELSPAPPRSRIDTPPTLLPTPQPGPVVDLTPAPPNPGPVIGTNPQPIPVPVPVPLPTPVPNISSKAVLLTSGDRLRPPYPASKIRLEEEASLRLRLAIDERGRVTSVDSVGPADPEFLASARSHLVRHWRYKPAQADGGPVATSIVITLRFRLDDA
jgi:periplasmic protein TonB